MIHSEAWVRDSLAKLSVNIADFARYVTVSKPTVYRFMRQKPVRREIAARIVVGIQTLKKNAEPESGLVVIVPGQTLDDDLRSKAS